MTDFGERDLLAAADDAGLVDLVLDYRASISPTLPIAGMDLTDFLRFVPNSTVPCFGDLIDEAFGPADRQLLLRHLEAQLAMGVGRSTLATSYLTGRRRNNASAS